MKLGRKVKSAKTAENYNQYWKYSAAFWYFILATIFFLKSS